MIGVAMLVAVAATGDPSLAGSVAPGGTAVWSPPGPGAVLSRCWRLDAPPGEKLTFTLEMRGGRPRLSLREAACSGPASRVVATADGPELTATAPAGPAFISVEDTGLPAWGLTSLTLAVRSAGGETVPQEWSPADLQSRCAARDGEIADSWSRWRLVGVAEDRCVFVKPEWMWADAELPGVALREDFAAVQSSCCDARTGEPVLYRARITMFRASCAAGEMQPVRTWRLRYNTTRQGLSVAELPEGSRRAPADAFGPVGEQAFRTACSPEAMQQSIRDVEAARPR